MLRTSLIACTVLLAACASPPVERQPQVTIDTAAPAPVKAGEQIHVLGEGEELRAVALRYGTTSERLIERNNIVSRKDLSPGRELIVPVPAAPAGTPPAGEAPAGGATATPAP